MNMNKKYEYGRKNKKDSNIQLLLANRQEI